MEKELTVPELVKVLRRCSGGAGVDCIGCQYDCEDICAQAAYTLAKLNDFQNSQLAKTLAENTRLAKELDAERQRRKHDA